MSNRRRHVGSRDDPETSNCLGVFGLSLYTTERELEKEFSKFGPLEKVSVVLDGKVSQFQRHWEKYQISLSTVSKQYIPRCSLFF